MDIILGGFLLVSVFFAARNGITREVVRIASLIIGLMLAMWGYGVLGRQLQTWIPDGRIAAVVAFAAIFLGCLVAGAGLAYVLTGVLDLTGLRWIDVALGGAFGLVRGLLLSVALVFVLLAFQPVPGASSMVAGSKIAPTVVSLAMTFATLAPKGLREAFGKGVERVHEERAGSQA